MKIIPPKELDRYNFPDYIKEQIHAAFGDISIKHNKYRNTIVEIDGIKFRSKKEGQRYVELKMLMKCGDVVDFKMQVPFEVSSANRKKIRYFLDFEVCWKNGTITYEDVKGKRLPLYKLKKSLVKEKYGIDIVEI